MENTIKKFNILDFVNRFMPKITELEWTSRHGVGLHDFEVEINFEGRSFLGRGSSSIKDHAIEIAITEALERIVLKHSKFENSNGCAGHFNLDCSKIYASSELIERHVFLHQFYSNNFTGSAINLSFENSWFSLKKNFINLTSNNYHIGSVDFDGKFLNVVLNLTYVSKNQLCSGYIIGLGCNEDIQKAKVSAEIESLRVTSHIYHNKIQSITPNDFQNLKHPSFEDHMLLSLNSAYSNIIRKKFYFENRVMKYCVSNITFDTLQVPQVFSDLGLFFVKAQSDKLLPLFTGFPNPIFIEKMMLLASSKPDIENFLIPHPLG